MSCSAALSGSPSLLQNLLKPFPLLSILTLPCKIVQTRTILVQLDAWVMDQHFQNIPVVFASGNNKSWDSIEVRCIGRSEAGFIQDQFDHIYVSAKCSRCMKYGCSLWA